MKSAPPSAPATEKTNAASSQQTQRTRTTLVTEQAEDAGGLLRQWLNDFLSELKTYSVLMDAPSGAGPTHKNKKKKFQLFTSGGGVYLPNRLVDEDGEDHPLDLTTPSADKVFEKQRVELYEVYRTVGKVINQMLRERVPLPEGFASPLLILYVRGAEGGIDNSELTAADIKRAILDFDQEYAGVLNTLSGSETTRRASMCNFIRDCIYAPRMGALRAIKSGFDIVPISYHLEAFSWRNFERVFVGRESMTAEDLLGAIRFSDETTPSFQTVFLEAVQKMDDQDARNLLRFCTGAPYLASDTTLYVFMKLIVMEKKRPTLPLATAFSCTSQLFVPYCAEISTADHMLGNLRNSFKWGSESEFHDASVKSVGDTPDASVSASL